MDRIKDIEFLREMRQYTQSLIRNKYDITKVEFLDKMIEDWIEELENNNPDTIIPTQSILVNKDLLVEADSMLSYLACSPERYISIMNKEEVYALAISFRKLYEGSMAQSSMGPSL